MKRISDSYVLLLFRVQLYIDNGWDKERLTDPDGGVHINSKLKESLTSEMLEIEEIFENLPFMEDLKWTQSLAEIPRNRIMHSGVEKYFENSGDAKHIKEGFTFSKTLKFETSGKPMRVATIQRKYFVLEGYTRPSMKSSKGISHGGGLYHCTILYSLDSGEILRAKDDNCPAGKRGYCKHVAALAYKLVDSVMTKKAALPQTLTCTQIKQQWGLPSLRAEQDPEKEKMKRVPLQDITFSCQKLDRDVEGCRKRKLPCETNSSYSSKPLEEPTISKADFTKLESDLDQSSSASTLLYVLKSSLKVESLSAAQSTPAVETYQAKQHVSRVNSNEMIDTPKQGSKAWHQLRVGKITSSKLPALVGLSGTTRFLQSGCNVRSKIEEERRQFANFDRGIIFEQVAANHFYEISGLDLEECPFVHHHRHPEIFGASPDRTFVSNQFFLKDISGTLIPIAGNFILEIKTRAFGGANRCKLLLLLTLFNSIQTFRQ